MCCKTLHDWKVAVGAAHFQRVVVVSTMPKCVSCFTGRWPFSQLVFNPSTAASSHTIGLVCQLPAHALRPPQWPQCQATQPRTTGSGTAVAPGRAARSTCSEAGGGRLWLQQWRRWWWGLVM
eukprot:CAMPEP_0177654160 /NCGR_PEP_ID=MMETSP0447-20121125/14156_1 /TAXON_ID=0 /ORGANISM="Stygamoeba regulata, Strain BSH-02190019" /LENGTH=121 /DNA_ID=CAMNT_0019157735 /DNA_START=121 /DNA_END=486 /DNA_ORIENTATION=+